MNLIPVPVPWLAKHWRLTSVEKLLAARSFNAFIKEWRACNARTGATGECFEQIRLAAAIPAGAQLTMGVVKELIAAAYARARLSRDPAACFLLLDTLLGLIELARIGRTDAGQLERLNALSDHTEADLYRCAIAAVGTQLGSLPRDLFTTDLLPWDQVEVSP